MNSSGIKRGLATTAVAALAVTGLPFLATSASAQPVSAAYGSTDVELVTPDNGGVSVVNDGQNVSASLVATGGSDVTSVQFQVSTNGGVSYTPIAGAENVGPRTDGVFKFDWAQPAGRRFPGSRRGQHGQHR